jgi:hypothetical protein
MPGGKGKAPSGHPVFLCRLKAAVSNRRF